MCQLFSSSTPNNVKNFRYNAQKLLVTVYGVHSMDTRTNCLMKDAGKAFPLVAFS